MFCFPEDTFTRDWHANCIKTARPVPPCKTDANAFALHIEAEQAG
jgi:hypothetical protein